MLKCTWRGCGRLTEQEPAVHVDPHDEATQDDRPDDGPFQPHTVDTSGYSQASHVGVASGEMMKKKISASWRTTSSEFFKFPQA